jgi:tetratricopeptide (TPR) repeat protein
MKKKTVYLIASILLVLAFLALLAALTWGKTLRVAKANRLLIQAEDPEGLAAAKRIYEDLLVDRPHSPYLLHNLGLALYRDKQAAAAAGRFQSAGEELAKMTGERRAGTESRRRLEHIFHYHQGSAWFTTAGEGAPEEAIAGYEKALAEFKEAIRANPDDLDAKYNYEVTLARLEEARQEQQEQQKDAGEKGREGQKGKGKPGDQDRDRQDGDQENREGEENRRGEEEQSQEDPGEQKDGQEQEEEDGSQSTESAAGNQEENSGMSKDEAMQLLEMAESGVLYQGPLFPEGPPAGKDW